MPSGFSFMRTLALPEAVAHWSLSSLREKLVKIDAKIVAHSRYVTFQMAEVAVPRDMFAEILRAVAAARINQREKCAVITGIRDLCGLRSPHSEGLGSKSSKIPPDVAGDGRDGYNVARNRGSSGECRMLCFSPRISARGRSEYNRPAAGATLPASTGRERCATSKHSTTWTNICAATR